METSFGQLPNEILVYIFQELGRATLKAVRLLSNRLNALATPLLDKDVSINLRGRMLLFETFKRRPSLRLVVRSVKCYGSSPYRQKEALTDSTLSYGNLQRRSQRLTLLHETCLTPYQKTELVLSLHVLPHWPNLRQIHSTTYVIRVLATLKHLHIHLPAVNTLSLSWSENPQLRQNDLVFWSETVRQLTLDQFPFKAIPVWLVQFGNITRLLLSKSINWSTEGAQLLLAMSQLQSLEDFRVFININYRSTNFIPSGLRSLKALRICFDYAYKHDKSPLVGVLYALVDAFAGQSHLHRLKLISRSEVETHFHADRLVGELLRWHGDTLTRLSLGEFRPSWSMFHKMINYRNMKRLTIGTTRTFANNMHLYLGSTSQLETLTLCFPKEAVHFSRSNVQALLMQTPSPLTTIKAKITSSWRSRMTRWTSMASYDSDIKRVVRVISGPMVPIQPLPATALCNFKSNQDD